MPQAVAPAPLPPGDAEPAPDAGPTEAPTPPEGKPPAYRAPVYVTAANGQTSPEPEQGPWQIRVVLRRTGDLKTDRRHLAQVFDLLTQYQGNDRFILIIPQNGGWVEVDFPNQRTGWCPQLEAALRELVGVERIDIQPWPGGTSS